MCARGHDLGTETSACFPVSSLLRPITTLARSVGDNGLCGINQRGSGTYTTVGINKLCDGLRGSDITSLGCAAAP